MTNITNITADNTKEVGISLLKKIIFFSGVFVNWIVEKANEWGIGLQERQVTVLFFLIDAIVLFLVLKFVAQPLLKIVIVILLIWIMIGFFV